MSASRVTVAAVIPHWNRRALLRRCCSCTRRPGLSMKIIVADNGWTTVRQSSPKRRAPRVLRLGRNFGFATAVNQGIQATQGDWVAILNNDVTLAPEWLLPCFSRRSNRRVRVRCCLLPKILSPEILRRSMHLRRSFPSACAAAAGGGNRISSLEPVRFIRIAPMTAACSGETLRGNGGWTNRLSLI